MKSSKRRTIHKTMSRSGTETWRPRRSAVLFSLLLMLFPAAIPVFSQDDVAVIHVEARGTAQIRGSDLARAREGAVRDAQRKAVRQVLLEVLKIEDPGKLPPGSDRLLARHDRYVDTFSVLEEGPDGGNYSVQLRVAVISEFLVHDLRKMGGRREGIAEARQRRIAVRVSGVGRFDRYVRVREVLSGIPGVRQVLPRKVARDEVWLEVESVETPAALAKHIESSGLFRVRKDPETSDRLDFEFLP